VNNATKFPFTVNEKARLPEPADVPPFFRFAVTVRFTVDLPWRTPLFAVKATFTVNGPLVLECVQCERPTGGFLVGVRHPGVSIS
jgi:hypothetical protein